MIVLGKWRWHDGVWPRWEAPEGARGLIDMRSLPQCGLPVVPLGYGLFDVEKVNPGMLYLGYDMEDRPAQGRRDAMEQALGVRVSGGTLGDILWDLFTSKRDPTGEKRWKGLMPTTHGHMEMCLGSWSRIRDFSLESEEWPGVQAQLHLEYRELRDACLTGKAPMLLYLKVLDYWCEKYRTKDWQLFVPRGVPLEEPVLHSTTVSDTFDRADQSDLGTSSEAWSWTTVQTRIDIVSNRARAAGAAATLISARAETDLSGTDHYCQADLISDNTSAHLGPAARFASAATTYYRVIYFPNDTNQYLSKVVTGTETHLNNASSSTGGTLKVECNGTAIKGYKTGVQVTTVTDSSISTGTRCGLAGLSDSVVVDNWSAADLTADTSQALSGSASTGGQTAPAVSTTVAL